MRGGSTTFEAQSQPFDGAQAPCDPRRKQRVDEAIGMRQERPVAACRARESVLNTRLVGERHEGLRVTEQRLDRWIPLQQVPPHLLG